MDKYRLPVAVADSPRELAEMVGTTVNSVYSGVSHGENGRKRSSFERAWVEDEEVTK